MTNFTFQYNLSPFDDMYEHQQWRQVRLITFYGNLLNGLRLKTSGSHCTRTILLDVPHAAFL